MTTAREILTLLGANEDDHFAVGQVDSSTPTRLADVDMAVMACPPNSNTYFAINPTSERETKGRADQTTRWLAISADLDAKPGGLETEQNCHEVIDALSGILGSEPTALIHTGHGLQPIWGLEGADDLTLAEREAARLRWISLVKHVASLCGGKVDGTFNLDRLHRAPETMNVKREPHVPTSAETPGGSPVSVLRLQEACDEYDIPETPLDEVGDAEPIATWAFAERTCPYVTKMISGWASDNPPARHPWLLASSVRLSAAHRRGCITEADHVAARELLEQRFLTLLKRAGEARDPSPNEFPSAWREGVRKVETKTADGLADELGNHTCTDEKNAHGTDGTKEIGFYASGPYGHHFANERLKDEWLYVVNIGWHEWDGTRWKRQDEGQLVPIALDFIRQEMHAEIDRGEHGVDAVIKKMQRYKEFGQTLTLIRAAATATALRARAEDLDSHEGLLNCANGVLNLETGELGPHDPALLLTKTTGTDYIADFTHPDWDKAISALPDDDCRAYLQRYIGAAATGERDREAPILFQQGDGENGKTTVMEALAESLGEYSALVPDKLLDGSGNDHDTLWMTLRGVRLAYFEELPEDHVLPIARVKKLANTSTITGRYMKKDYVTFPATHSLVGNTNYAPIVRETDHGTWRRLAMMPYPFTFTGDKADPTIKRRLRNKQQQSAVLAWFAAGARIWYLADRRIGDMPEAVAEATKEWKAESDPLAAFIGESIIFTGDDSDRVLVAELLDYFNRSLATGSKAWSQTLFSRRLKAHSMIKEAGAVVDRGHRNQEKRALTRTRWNESAPGAPGYFATSRGESSSEKYRHNPAHPAQTPNPPTNHENGQNPATKKNDAETLFCSVCAVALCEADVIVGSDRCSPCDEANSPNRKATK
jgi:P4 family phage/plasmid primase-like protien